MNNVLVDYIKKHEVEFKESLKLIEKYDRIAIFRHRVPDFDALGTQLGLKYFLKEHFPNKEIIVLGDDHIKFTPRLFEYMDNVENEWFNKPFLAIICDVSDPDRVADERVQFVDRTVALDAFTGFRHTLAAHQRGIALISRSGINYAFLHSMYLL